MLPLSSFVSRHYSIMGKDSNFRHQAVSAHKSLGYALSRSFFSFAYIREKMWKILIKQIINRLNTIKIALQTCAMES
jgi:hypothetical protein